MQTWRYCEHCIFSCMFVCMLAVHILFFLISNVFCQNNQELNLGVSWTTQIAFIYQVHLKQSVNLCGCYLYVNILGKVLVYYYNILLDYSFRAIHICFKLCIPCKHWDTEDMEAHHFDLETRNIVLGRNHAVCYVMEMKNTHIYKYS